MSENFEKSSAELEAVVRKLEEGGMPLDEALALFEKGVRLSGECNKLLGDAASRIDVLLSEENWQTAPFASEED